MMGFYRIAKLGPYLIALKSPTWPVIFSERYRQGVRVIPLGRGWRITIRKCA